MKALAIFLALVMGAAGVIGYALFDARRYAKAAFEQRERELSE